MHGSFQVQTGLGRLNSPKLLGDRSDSSVLRLKENAGEEKVRIVFPPFRLGLRSFSVVS
jgi:hypothetical protein